MKIAAGMIFALVAMKRWKLWHWTAEALFRVGITLAMPGLLLINVADWCQRKSWASKPVKSIHNPNFVRATDVE